VNWTPGYGIIELREIAIAQQESVRDTCSIETTCLRPRSVGYPGSKGTTVAPGKINRGVLSQEQEISVINSPTVSV